MAGSPPDASALDASSLNRFCGDASSITLGHLTLNCPIGQSFLDSIIPADSTPIPEDGHEVNYNLLDDIDGWGYDGKGVVFTGSENLVPDKDDNPNPQMRTAKRGDKVTVSIKGTPGHYVPGSELPLFWYELRAELTQGLVPDENSIQIKVDGTVLDSSLYTLSVEDLGGSSAEGIGYVIAAKLEWAEYTKPYANPMTWEFIRHLYDEDTVAELSFSAMVGQDTPSTASITATNKKDANGATQRSSTKSPATILIDGNLVIQRVDESGEPLAGASYSIAGLKATKDALNDNVYHYDSNGDITSFTTGEAGKIVILGVPLGQYTVTETATPEGHTIKQETQQVEVSWLSSSIEQYDSAVFEGLGNDLAKHVTRLTDGSYVLSPAAYSMSQDTIAYDSESNSYTGVLDMPYTPHITITKDGNNLTWTRGNWTHVALSSGNFIFDEQLGKYTTTWAFMPVSGTPQADISITKEGNTLKIDDHGSYKDIPFIFDSSDGCYHYEAAGSDGALEQYITCEENNGYTLKFTADYSELFGTEFILVIAYRYDYDENSGMYSRYSAPSTKMVIDEITSEKIKLTGYAILNYSPSLDIFYTTTMATGNSIHLSYAFRKTIKPTEVYGTNVLFSEMADDTEPTGIPADTPEAIPNPQTSDAILQILAISTIALLSAFAIRKHLSRR